MSKSILSLRDSNNPVRIAFVLHVMQIAGAEVLVSEIIQRLRSQIAPVVFCLDTIGQLGEHMKSKGVSVISFDRRPGIDIGVSIKIAKELRQRNIEIVHAHQYTPFFYSALAKIFTTHKFRLIFTEHGRHYPDVVSVKRRWVNKYFFTHYIDEINAVSHFSAQALSEKEGFPSKRIQVIENGIIPDKYKISSNKTELKEKIGLAPDRRFLICVARFHPVKDHITLLKAFSKITQKLPDIDLLLAGDGPLRKTLEQQAEQLSISHRVHFLGIRQDIPELMHLSDVFTLTSVSEAASITLLEAMASSLPVVVTDVGGNPEIVKSGINGFLVPSGDDSKIAEAYVRLFTDTQLYCQMAENNRHRIMQNFLLDRTIESYRELYIK
jgi:N-acetyl-alpha-D-glucosaminyl L-malate synthase BshA